MEKRIKVLMVDDETQFRETTSKILTRKGFSTTLAESGEAAIGILEKDRHDVVILDIRMPGMDGHTTLAAIKKIYADLPVIMLTGHGDQKSAVQSRDQGAFDYLGKPCDIDLLAAKIQSAYHAAQHKDPGQIREKRARDIMIHIDDYTLIRESDTVADAINELKKSFEGFAASSRLMETGHRSVLVMNDANAVTGILSIESLIDAVRPSYLSAPKPSMADSMQYSPMFWDGLFTTQVRAMAMKPVSQIMSEAPPVMDEETRLMSIADFMHEHKVRRVLITRNHEVIGVIREQDMFFEMANIIL